jgi:hypothetical protein
MATLKDDDSSWKAGGIKRRDFRHTKNGPHIPKHQGKKKKTKKWCKGIEGREHVIKHTNHPRYSAYAHVDLCEICGKEVKMYFGGWEAYVNPCDGCGKFI